MSFCNQCWEMPCACEENAKAQGLLEDKAALFDEMREALVLVLPVLLSSEVKPWAAWDIETKREAVKFVLDRANKLVEASQ